jgi:hypothetical protein
VNDLFRAAGAPAAAGTNYELVATATAPVFFNVNVIDNGSGDSVFALPSPDVPKPAAARAPLAASPETVTVPASASIHGAAGTFFHTDLWATNRSFDGPITVTAHLRCATGHCTDTVKTFDLAARETKLFEDVVGSFFFSPESSAAIELTWDSSQGDLFATTRTYTPELPAPTSGTTIPAQGVNDVKIRALFLGVAGNGGDSTTGFRTNAGAYNAFPIATTVTFSLYDASGRLLGEKTYPWAAFQAWQLNDVFATLGAGATVARDAYLVASSPLPLFFYVTVIDDRSGDSFYVFSSNDEATP